ncbi:MAG: hypothetical protein AUI10_07855, partial [Actinobacteria bacterium 13_2_20CM_2_72_6]
RRIVYPYLDPIDGVTYPESAFSSVARDASLIVLTNAGFARSLAPAAAQLDAPVAVDVNVISDCDQLEFRTLLEASDVIFCSDERLLCSPERWIEHLLERYPRAALVAVGCGERGSVLGLRDGRLAHVGSVAPLGVASTSSAGDSLFATFLHYWLRIPDPIEALRRAALYAGWRVGHRDPTTVLLDEQEVERLWRQHPVPVHISSWTR